MNKVEKTAYVFKNTKNGNYISDNLQYDLNVTKDFDKAKLFTLDQSDLFYDEFGDYNFFPHEVYVTITDKREKQEAPHE